jgi:RNA polymerase primary sigma factor
MKAKLVEEIGREPSQKELAEALGWKEEKVKIIQNLPRIALSLDMPTGVEEDSYLGESIEDIDGLSPPDGATKEVMGEQLREAVSSLTPREARVIELRFGQDRTLEEVGEIFGLTRERIRQIQVEALRKLRHPSRARELKDYLRR